MPKNLYGVITPYHPEKVSEVAGHSLMSFGAGHGGYDITLGDSFFITNPLERMRGILDPKDPAQTIDKNIMIEMKATSAFLLNPHDFILGVSREHFAMPDDVMALAVGKSSYARNGIITNVTPLEPGWEGYLTIEISNTTPYKVWIYPNEGICQLVFFQLPEMPTNTYNGKYQNQPEKPVLSL